MWPGFSFALHLLRVQGFYFALLQYSPIQAFTVHFVLSMQFYTAHATKPRAGLYRRFSCDFPHSTAHDTRPTQAAIIPPAPRWSTSQRPDAIHRYQIPPQRRTLYRPAQPPYYNKVYKGAGGAAYRRPSKPGGVSPAACDLAPVSSQGTACGAEPLTATAVSLFGLSPDS